MRTILKVAGKVAGSILVLALVLAGGLYVWASAASARTLSRAFDSHAVDFPVPFPLPAHEVEELGLTPPEAETLALERALERGAHLLRARYACTECHGENFGGGVMFADMMEDHHGSHATEPPATEVSLEFGRHLAAVCTGCHGLAFTGGPIAGGDPSWVPAANLTPHQEGLAGWSYADFRRAMVEAVRPDGAPIREPMSLVTPFAVQMTEVEMEALWLYLTSLDPRPYGG